ncbi:Mrp/NBP35 family ATP-binding protein [Roseivirga thermotolerans]|uniref:Iron-sulfur cluster carrier protein n=1 Tax=Roseivirga thermotolerans TaxID=1758176 RepID=A0ABQ3I4L0_9BACT|nr:Mrp/NBP35 family ATP-binding protein [Roseivirga thermotolerans]GHE61254.1 iron-sulfur cluster carrier protein [Roseivirga thermotolerans]
MALTKESVLAALRHVQDPDIKQDLVTLNMIQDIEINGNELAFTVMLTTPACPLKELIRKDCEQAIATHIGKDVVVKITMSSHVTSARDNAPLLPGVKNIIAVASGKGGVGKSTVTANLAVALAKQGAKVGVIDADIFGPSMPTMFNCEHEQPGIKKVGDKNLIVPVQQYGVKLISIGLLTPAENAVVWRGPMASSALKQFIADTEWGDLDYLFIDLPPGTSDIHLTLVQTVPVTGAVLVTTPQKVALVDAQKGLNMFQQPQINVPVLGVIENMAYFTPEELPENKYYIFGKGGGRKLAERHKVPFIGEIPLVQSIREGGDVGYPAIMQDDVTGEAFLKVAEATAQQIAIRNAEKAQTKKVEIKV